MTVYVCPSDAVHRAWDYSLPIGLTIEPGDSVTFSTIDAGDNRIPLPPGIVAPSPAPQRGRYPSIHVGHPLCGPIAIHGVLPGDILDVTIRKISTAVWGWTGFRSGGGLLGAEVTEDYLVQWDLRGEHAVPWPIATGASETERSFQKLRIPMRPFCGIMGVAPAEPGALSTIPPRAVGGNMDVRRLTTGSTVHLPVAVEGALFSVGDVHAAQGDGEVCGTGIECAATVELSFDIRRSRHIETPEYTVPFSEPLVAGPYYGTMGVAPDLMEASRQAIRRMIAYLHDEYGLSFSASYILCSVAVNLAISEVVDPPNWVVSAELPLDVLG